MKNNYIKPDNWSIIEEGFDKTLVKSTESLMSLGNGAMGQRANFEEHYSGETFQGSYVAGVYYPDKTRVGWWKNGYPEYFAKVLNAPNWIGINVSVNGEQLDLATCIEVKDFRRELNMKEGWLSRSFKATLENHVEIQVETKRFLSLDYDEIGAIEYHVTPLNSEAQIIFSPYLDNGITNEDSNWDDKFWDILSIDHDQEQAFIVSRTMKTNFYVCTSMQTQVSHNGQAIKQDKIINDTIDRIEFVYKNQVSKGDTITLTKFGGYTSDRYHDKNELVAVAKNTLKTVSDLGFDVLLDKQKASWASIWDMADITIEGDVAAQQGIRFNIFHLNQTYLGTDARLNIGPKGFTGEKYGGSTYWDTEAYCIPFYMATKDQNVAKRLLEYRYNHLEKAIENAEKLGFTNGAALYPMVTMNGEECHNEWEITFEEIHRNGAIAFAIFNYHRYTGDYSYIPQKGLEVLIGIARFWHQRATFSEDKQKYVILGVTGPNEYENNVNNNWYTNYIAKWCIEYALENISIVENDYTTDYTRIMNKAQLSKAEMEQWKSVATQMYFPYSEKHDVFLQQDGFLDKELITVSDLPKSERPINQKWSWDRILRSPYIKQADTLQGFYFFEDHFSINELERHFDFYEPFTVHESSLSPCVHSIQAAKLDRMDQAYAFYLRTSRLDLDDYNHEVEEGLHITSMAGTWMSIVEGFGGMRVVDGKLSFEPKIPEQWEAFSFKINFRHQILKVNACLGHTHFVLEGDSELEILVNGKSITISPNNLITV
ncbi:glycoside hydrolase family 65 protein [Psychroserpens sp.]|uniref:glycoside hydrolase family 65 protein n=1 Tax=Psychroserpens sp. TaxID=2020870 RepID=UPI001B2D44AE|nr:glycoside hydrolase family 65 protein [Psychroserpens sp.]MBO6605738.1 glycoside hydrolase family 65 protein [Psychroserpens sp.]MBO6630720.1 glycoside hydrolase family 65 protein [Psychroserpens sp.]MBO6652891.1 glycoside hydrolase family 65 protein [Psychroserpens sp.]MBO6681337.1 glycoside hydrolase family 65 protein [Psychroserpens sp.]MBO6749112.1 glycoside hydrolase family 65 protein [Psychroserpens sp.]